MNKRIGIACIFLSVSWGVMLAAQTNSPVPGADKTPPSAPSSSSENVSQAHSSSIISQNSVTHWYADAAKVGLLATVLSVLATIFYTVLTAIIVRYMRRQTLLQKRVNDVQIFEMIVRRLEATREARALIREYVKKGTIVVPPPSPVLEAVDSVCREFDFLGLLDRKGLVDRRLVDEFYSVPFVLLYEQLLGTYSKYLRDEDRRGHTHFWELEQFYERVQYVPKNHPGKTPGAKEWPADARIWP